MKSKAVKTMHRQLKRVGAMAVLAMFLPSMDAMAAELTGEVRDVLSGDLIMVVDAQGIAHEVKLAGIDAPDEGQPYFKRSRAALAHEIKGKQVRVEYRAVDGSRQLLGKVLMGSEDINMRQLQLGMAWFYRKHLNMLSGLDSTLFSQQEHKARAQHAGLWHDRNPVSPSQYRRNKSAHQVSGRTQPSS